MKKIDRLSLWPDQHVSQSSRDNLISNIDTPYRYCLCNKQELKRNDKL